MTSPRNTPQSVVASSPFEERVGQWMVYFADRNMSFDAVNLGESMGRPPLDQVAQAADAQFFGGLLNAWGYRRQLRTGLAALFNPHTGERSGTLVYPTPDDVRTPEAMPTDWVVERAEGWGQGVLARGAERVPVDGQQWTGGGDLPRGETVHVEWMRSPTGRFNVVARVSRPRVAAPPPSSDAVPMATQRAAWTTRWRFTEAGPADDDHFEAALADALRAFAIDDEPSIVLCDVSSISELAEAIHVACVDDGSAMTSVWITCPLLMKGDFELTNETLELRWGGVEGSPEGLFLLLAHVVKLLGGEPERDDEDDVFVEELEGRVRACVLDHLGMSDLEDDEALERRIVPTSTTVSPGVVGPYATSTTRDQDGIHLVVRGAGRDLRVTLGGEVLALDDAALAPLYDTFDTELAEMVADEQTEARGRSEPTAEPAFGGRTVLHGWKNGARVSSRIVDGGPGAALDLPEAGADDVAWDLVRYLADGTPLARWSNATVRALNEIPNLTPCWHWTPASDTDAPARFAALVAKHVPRERDRIPLRDWYRAFRQRSGKLQGLPLHVLYAHICADGMGDIVERHVSPFARTAKSFMGILVGLAATSSCELEPHRTWLCRGSWWNESEPFAEDIHRAMQLPGEPSSVVPREPAQSAVLSLREYLGYSNAAADAAGTELRAFEVAVDGDWELVVCLPPPMVEALVGDGLLFLA
ncbi:MAG: hypothetical protein HOO96_26920 [Polyangiaceae bacterium]|nr:hypothetical protein [Polyangiaceae bacterium]